MGGAASSKAEKPVEEVFEDSIAPAKVQTFGREDDEEQKDSDSDFTEEIERDDDDTELFEPSTKAADEIEKSTGTFGGKHGLHEQLQQNQDLRKINNKPRAIQSAQTRYPTEVKQPENKAISNRQSNRPISGITSNLRSDFATSTNKSFDRDTVDHELDNIEVDLPVVANVDEAESYDFSQNRREQEGEDAKDQSEGDFGDRDDDSDIDIEFEKTLKKTQKVYNDSLNQQFTKAELDKYK